MSPWIIFGIRFLFPLRHRWRIYSGAGHGRLEAKVPALVHYEGAWHPRQTKALFGCSRIRINPHVLGWIGVDLELNSTLIHSNTCGLR